MHIHFFINTLCSFFIFFYQLFFQLVEIFALSLPFFYFFLSSSTFFIFSGTNFYVDSFMLNIVFHLPIFNFLFIQFFTFFFFLHHSCSCCYFHFFLNFLLIPWSILLIHILLVWSFHIFFRLFRYFLSIHDIISLMNFFHFDLSWKLILLVLLSYIYNSIMYSLKSIHVFFSLLLAFSLCREISHRGRSLKFFTRLSVLNPYIFRFLQPGAFQPFDQFH
jgi:hypothetical protein